MSSYLTKIAYAYQEVTWNFIHNKLKLPFFLVQQVLVIGACLCLFGHFYLKIQIRTASKISCMVSLSARPNVIAHILHFSNWLDISQKDKKYQLIFIKSTL